MTEVEPIMRLNPQTGKYVGHLQVEVDAEIFRRLLIKDVEENERADLTNPATWAASITRVGKITSWLGRPHVTVIPVEDVPHVSPKVPVKPVVAEKEKEKWAASRTTGRPRYGEINADLRVRACSVPPYRWQEEFMVPIPPGSSKKDYAKQQAYYIRSDQRKALTQLTAEWEAGAYSLTPEAAAQQEAWVTKRIEAVAEVVNGTRLK